VRVEFADVTLDAEAMELERAGRAVPVEPQVMEVLSYLVAHRERVVPKTELLDEIWGDRFVSESALSSRIKSARQAIGDNGRDQRLIRTVHGRGFRFVGEVRDGLAAAPLPAAGDGVDWGPVLAGLAEARGAAVQVVGPAGPRHEAVDALVHQAEGAGLLTARSQAGGSLRPYAGVLDALDEVVVRRGELLEDVPATCRVELESVLDGAAPTSPQRLLVAARELLGAAGRAGGMVLVVEDAHLLDRATLELVHHLARGTRGRPVLLVVTTRPGVPPEPWFDVIELAGDHRGADDLPLEVRAHLERVAVLGEWTTFEEAVAAMAAPLAVGRRALEVATAAGTIERDGAGIRFTDPAVAAALAAAVTPPEAAEVHRRAAEQLIAQGADAGRIAERLLAAGDGEAAAPHLLRAAQEAAGRQAHRDVLARAAQAAGLGSPATRRALLELRADALAEVADPEAVRAYRALVAEDGDGADDWLRARLARSLVRANDPRSAWEALAGIDLGAVEDPRVRLVAAMVLYLTGDVDAAERLVDGLRDLALAPGASAEMLDVIAVQGMVAHSRGEWFDRLRVELRLLAGSADLARTVFDAHLCVGQYLLYGPTGYGEVVELAGDLRRSGEAIGSDHAVAFADTLAGEALLLSGDLAGAREHLESAVATYRATGADTGLAHSLQRLAEVHLQSGDPAEATRLVQQALPLARWSPLSQHLLQRAYGTLVAAAPTSVDAAVAADDALATLDSPDACEFCQVMVAVPAAIAYAGAGRLEDARAQLAVAERVAVRWDGVAWVAAVDEAAAVVARAEGREAEAAALLERAARGFDEAGQPLDAARCREAL
jgi:DNA-binding winged helix-turn-helix (wHTH) protein/tetratricopeptide (TPR) repeat protein